MADFNRYNENDGTRYRDRKGNVFSLPKMTLSIQEKIDAVQEIEDKRALYQEEYDLMCELFPLDYLDNRLDGDTVDTIDVQELTAMFVEVVSAYSQPILDAQARSIDEQAKAVQRMAAVADSATKVASFNAQQRTKAEGGRQVFRKAK